MHRGVSRVRIEATLLPPVAPTPAAAPAGGRAAIVRAAVPALALALVVVLLIVPSVATRPTKTTGGVHTGRSPVVVPVAAVIL